MRNVDKDPEHVYECRGWEDRPCGTLHSEATISTRPLTDTLYCDQCQSEDLRLCVEEVVE